MNAIGTHTRTQEIALHVQRYLKLFPVRLGLSVAIIVSLLPMARREWVELVFLVAFALEFVLRCVSFAAPRDPNVPRSLAHRRILGNILFLILDFLALLSFIPWASSPQQARWLRIFRLTRLLVLVSYWGNVARDIWAILSRRERARQLGLMTVSVALMAFTGAVLLDQLTMSGVDFNGDGVLTSADESFLSRLWWSFMQMEDPGNLIAHPNHSAALIVSLTLTLFGLFLVSFLIGLGSDVVHELMLVSQSRPLGLRKHTIIVHSTSMTHRLLKELMRFYGKMFTIPRYLIVGRNADPPDFLASRTLPRCSYRSAVATDLEFIRRSDASEARRLIILARPESEAPDAETVETILNFREVNREAWVVAEILDHSNAAAARVAGGAHTVVVPTEKLLALYVSTTAMIPNRDRFRNELLTSRGHEIYTYYYDHSGLGERTNRLHLPPGCRARCILDAAQQFQSETSIIPIGFIRDSANPKVEFLNANSVDDSIDPGEVEALVVLGSSFEDVREFALWLRSRDLGEPGANTVSTPAAPSLILDQFAGAMERVLICGYRPASINLCEALLTLNSKMEILILVDAKDDLQSAQELMEERNIQIQSGLLHEHGPTGRFICIGDNQYSFQSAEGDTSAGLIQLIRADWTQERVLFNLPASFETIHRCDLVVFFSDGTQNADARTSMAFLKLAHAVGRQGDKFPPHFQVVAQVDEDDLAQRLEHRYRSETGQSDRPVRVLSQEDLRALFSFQSAMVPGFDAIYSELMAPTGPALLRLVPDESVADDRLWSFAELSRSLRDRGQIPLALVLNDAKNHKSIRVAPPSDQSQDSFHLSEIEALWVLGTRSRR